MKKHVLCGALFATTCLTSPALAQSINDTVPPERQNLDANFVDRATGSVYYPHPALAIGPAGRGGLSVTGASGYNGNNSDNGGAPGGAGTNWGLVIYASGSTYTVGLGQTGDAFTLAGRFTSNTGSGATLTRTASGSSYTYTYVAADGTRIVYDKLSTSIFEANSGIKAARATKITYPTGEVVTLSWTTGRFCTNDADACAGGTYQSRVRLQSVSSSLGYQLQYNYAQDTTTGGPSDASFFNQLVGIQAINTKKDACALSAGSCAVSNQPDRRMRVAANWSGSGATFQSTNQFTDPEGRVTTFTNKSSQLAVQTPGHGSANIVYAVSGGQVTNVTRDGLSYRYDQSVSGTVRTVKVTDPVGNQKTTTADTAQYQLLTSTDGRKSPQGQDYTTTNVWDPTTHRLNSTSFPEGNAVEYQYDDRGNITRTTLRGKNGTDTITTSAIYPDTCANALTCNQPTSTTDANNKTTSYTYDPTHGGIATVTRPAVDNGQGSTVSPVIIYSYGQPNGQAVWRPSTVSTCRTQASCAGTADEIHTWYSNFDDNLNVTGVHVGSGDRTLEVVTTATFDAAGNQLTTTDANGNATRAVFNKDREVVGTIGTDPDGIGTGNWAKAQRISRDGHGWVSKVEEGTAPGQSDSDWNSFSSHREVDIQYDDAGRKTRQTLRAGSTNYAETQFSYDGGGRLDCTAVRMNPGAFGSTTSACDWVTDTNGPFGPDRIGRNEYDAASEVTRAWSGYRSPQARPEDATYTPNGKVQTRLDGKGNRTGYVYDGFDRLYQVFYPDKSNVGASSSSDYEQFQYDGNGNLAFRFLRGTGDGITYQYDALNRLTAKRGSNGDTPILARTYSYDFVGNLTQARFNTSGQTVTASYDALGRKLTENSGLGAVSSTYDAGGRRTQMKWSDNNYVTYQYDHAGQVIGVLENGSAQLASLTYDDDGRRTSLCFAGRQDMCTSYGFDPVSQLNQLNISSSVSAGTSIQLRDQPNSSTGANPAGQIGYRTNSNDAFSYGVTTGSANYSVNGLNQYTQAGVNGIGSDPHGNVTNIGSTTYTYDGENLLTRVSAGNVTLGYDPLNRLASVTPNGTGSTNFQWDGDDNTAVYVTGSIARRYVFLPGGEPIVWYEGAGLSDKRFLQADERGSIVRVANGSNTTLVYNKYDEFGVNASGNSGRFQYTGQAWIGNAGLYYYKARFYAPSIGRFMQTDPIGYDDGMNWYNYAHGDSVNNVDSTGLTYDDGVGWTITGVRLPGPMFSIVGDTRTNDIDRAERMPRTPPPQNSKPPCSRTDRALQDAGKFISDIGGDITAGSADVGLVGGALVAGGALTGNVPAAGVGVILLGRAGAGITVGGFVSYVGSFLQVAGGASKAAVSSYVNNAIASRIPGLPQVAGSYLKMGLKKAEALLPDLNVCSR